jgi:hypothetical protein
MPEISDAEFLASHPEHENLDPAIRAQLKRLAQADQDLAETRQALADVTSKQAFADAGLPAGALRDLIQSQYKGELTPEAILAEAAKFNLVPATTTTSTAGDTSLDTLRRLQAASAGGGGTPNATEDFERRLDGARTAAEFDAILASADPALGVRLKGMVQGNRVI